MLARQAHALGGDPIALVSLGNILAKKGDATAAAAAFKATFNDPAASEQLRAIAYQRLTAQGPQAMAAAAVLEAEARLAEPVVHVPDGANE